MTKHLLHLLTDEEARELVQRAAAKAAAEAEAAPSENPFPTREALHRDDRGRWVTADGRLVDLAAVSRRSMAQMTTGRPPDPKGEPGSGLQYSQTHYVGHIH